MLKEQGPGDQGLWKETEYNGKVSSRPFSSVSKALLGSTIIFLDLEQACPSVSRDIGIIVDLEFFNRR